jgi:hypothetical protein
MKMDVWRVVGYPPGKKPFHDLFQSKKRAERIAEECGGKVKPIEVDI